MIYNYFKIALRNLKKNKLYATINIVGLSVGILCTILILLYVNDELSYDKHFENAENIYRIEAHFHVKDKEDHFALAPVPLAQAIKQVSPEIDKICRIRPLGKPLLKYDNEDYYVEGIYYADSTLLDIFSHKIISGNSNQALSRPFTAIISRSLKERIFGDKEAVGEILTSGRGGEYEVTAVFEDLPQNSHMSWDCILSGSTLVQAFGGQFEDPNNPQLYWNVQVFTFALMNPNSSTDAVLKHWQQYYDENLKSVGDQLNMSFYLTMTPLLDIHLNSTVDYDFPKGNKQYVLILTIIAIFILIIASINYMNLATASSAKRAREVGMRKVVGATRGMLASQFITESMVFAIIALIIGTIAAIILLPSFNDIAGKDMSFQTLLEPKILFSLILITLFVGFISGSYPAFFLSSFNPAKVLKGKIVSGRGSGFIRKALVVFQFVISIVLIIATVIITQQLNFLQNKDLGYDPSNVIITSTRDSTAVANYQSFKEEMERNPNVKKVSLSSGAPYGEVGLLVHKLEDEKGEMVERPVKFMTVGSDYKELLGIEMKDGRWFDVENGTDFTEACLINETAAREFGWGKDAIGKKIDFGVGFDGGAFKNAKVVGIMKDFHFESLHNEIEPLVFYIGNGAFRRVNIKTVDGKVQETLDFMESIWDDFSPNFPMDYFLLEDNLHEFYDTERRLSKIFTYFSFICIVIACMGLFGLSSFITEQRTKEIGIRKVLGASVNNLMVLLSKDFAKWVGLANIFAWPLAWYISNRWLESFPFRISPELHVFVFSGIAALVIALITVSYHTYRAANNNPVEALKYE